MDNAIYAALTRQAGLINEMQAVANNIANISTSGFRKEGLVFAEYIAALDGPAGSLSMASAEAKVTLESQGALKRTGGSFDLAIEGPGYFLVRTSAGDRLTRAGSFAPAADGILNSPDGFQVLDAGGAPVFIPPGSTSIDVAPDGTLSADGVPQTQIGLYLPANPLDMRREDGVRFAFDGALVPADRAQIVQGFVEGSNVSPVAEVARMIEVQRAYELGQAFLEREDQRISKVISSVGRN